MENEKHKEILELRDEHRKIMEQYEEKRSDRIRELEDKVAEYDTLKEKLQQENMELRTKLLNTKN